MEKWKDIAGTYYSVSDQGRVASRRFQKMRVLLPRTDRGGYMNVVFSDGGTRKHYKVHRLVAETFIGLPPTPSHQVNHKNGVKTDNQVDNLEWASCGENMRHRFRVLGQKGPHGASLPQTKLTEVQVHDIRSRLAIGEPQAQIARRYGVHPRTIKFIAIGKNWAWLI